VDEVGLLTQKKEGNSAAANKSAAGLFLNDFK